VRFLIVEDSTKMAALLGRGWFAGRFLGAGWKGRLIGGLRDY
jgi:hypothetical protein